MKIIILVALSVFSLVSNAQQRSSSELFIEVKDAGKYEVTVNDDYAASRSGRFRYYDLPAGLAAVTISLSGRPVFKRDISLRQGIRTIGSYSKRDGFRIFDELAMYQAGGYELDNWNGQIMGPDSRPDGWNRPGIREMRADDFARLTQTVRKEGFDDAKVRVMNIALQNNRVSVNQLVELLRTLSFDDNKLKAALASYNSVYDRVNYYLVRNVFSFSDNKEKLDNFLLKQG